MARGQQRRPYRIGVLVPANPEPFWTEFRGGLRELGYIEGKNMTFELRSADGEPNRLRDLADELVRLKVDVIAASLTPAVTAARRATTEIPIVMAAAGDPILTGLISSLARPGGNITGLSTGALELYVKVLELIHEVMPSVKRVALLVNLASQLTNPLIERMEDTGRALAIAIQAIKIRSADEFDAAFAAMKKDRVDAVMLQSSLPRKPVVDLALRYRLPLAGPSRQLAEEGGLMSYIANENDQYRRAASYVDRILKGAKPADLPVEQPTRYELVVNLKTAKILAVTVPPAILARADHVIE